MQTAPQLKIKRSPCKGSFDRSSIQQVANIPHSEIADVVDKVELVAGNFKWRKALKVFACVYLFFLLAFIACSVTRAVAGGHRGPRGAWGQNGMVSSGPHHGGVRGPAGDARGGHHWGMGGGFGRHHKFRMMRHFMKKLARRFRRGFRQGFRGMRHHRFGGSPRNHHGQRPERPNHPRNHHKKRAPEGPVPVPAPAHDQAQPEITMIPTDPNNPPTGEVTIQNKPEVAPAAPVVPAPSAPEHIKDPEAPTIVENRAGPILPTPAPSDATNGPTEAPRKPHHKGPSRPDFKEHGPDSQNGPVPPQDVRGQHPPRPETQGPGIRDNKLPHEQPGATTEGRAPQPAIGGPFGPRGGRHYGKARAAKLLLLFVILPLLVLLAFRCKAKRVAKKVKALLEIENRHFAARYGYVWTVDKKLTELSLTPVNGQPQPAEPQVGQGYHMPYPPMMMVPQYAPQMMPAHQGAPLFTENSPRVTPSSPRQAFGGPRGGYQRVSLDDSTVGYTYK